MQIHCILSPTLLINTVSLLPSWTLSGVQHCQCIVLVVTMVANILIAWCCCGWGRVLGLSHHRLKLAEVERQWVERRMLECGGRALGKKGSDVANG